MGTKFLKAAFSTNLPSSERFLLVALADAANDKTGLCNPSQDLLVQKTGFGKRTVIRLLGNLKDAGYISIERESRTDKNRYVLHLDRSANLAPRTKCQSGMSRSANMTPREVPSTTVRSAIDDTSKCHSGTSTQYYTNPKINPKEPEVLTPPSGSVSEKSDFDQPEKPAKKKRKPSADSAEKKPRERDLLFDAIVEVCRMDPAAQGGVIGSCKKTLLKYNPPATPDEVRLFGRVYEKKHPMAVVPTWNVLANQFAIVRDAATVERILAGPRRHDSAQAYRERIQQHDPSQVVLLTPEEIAELESEELSF